MELPHHPPAVHTGQQGPVCAAPVCVCARRGQTHGHSHGHSFSSLIEVFIKMVADSREAEGGHVPFT